MLIRLHNKIRKQVRLRSLSAKMLYPTIGLMLASLLVSTLAFILGTARTHNNLVEQQARLNLEQVRASLNTRAETLHTATH